MQKKTLVTDIQRLEHGGNIHKVKRNHGKGSVELIDFSANINPLGPPPWLRSHINKTLESILHYPDPECKELIQVISSKYQVSADHIIAANGSTELLHLLPSVISKRRVIIPVPCYIEYLTVFERHGFDVQPLVLDEKSGFRVSLTNLTELLSGGELVIFGNPVNPSGTALSDDKIIACAQRNPDTLFVIDEAFHEFVSEFKTVGGRLDNIITLNSLTKFFAVPGLRVGFGIFSKPYYSELKKLLPPWTVNSLAQAVAVKALQDDAYCLKTREACIALKKDLREALEAISDLTVFDSTANYLLMKLNGKQSAERLYRELLKEHIIIRRCGNYQGLDDSFIRVAVRTEEQNNKLINALKSLLGSPKPKSVVHQKKCKTIMFQGTSSNAGKSVLCAALCRILLQDGFNVCPFKAQNMSLNSHVTLDGGEMGRAQVVQAQAAKVDPDWRMNPVLLKPNSDTGSQVIVNGKPVGNMNVRQYHGYKDEAWKAVAASFDELAEHYDVIVLEGAGSPGEINLKHHDIVNMKMARYARAPVLLVGDIDRGGVYASFAGIMDVLEEWERSLIAGFVVNKFRGDESLLAAAHRFIQEHTGRQVFGVVPYITDIVIPQEDSVSLREGFYRDRGTNSDQVEIAVIDIPHISNFTDIDPLYHEPDVNIRFISDRYQLGSPDAIIIPGSKNVAGDLRYLRNGGIDRAIVDYVSRGGLVVGICGGYQMLGRQLNDPHKIETNDGTIIGLALLEIDTVLAPEKTLTRRNGKHIESGCTITGYEIHHGLSESNSNPVLRFENGETCGSTNHDGTIWGAYLHGIFDEDNFRRWFIDSLRLKKNLEPLGSDGAAYNIDKSIDELADLVRSRLDIQAIYALMNIEV